jgi:peptidoglycan/LPS O-acetylase OafA/YrhL
MWIAMFAATLALAAVFRAVVEKPTLSLRDAISARLGPGRTAQPIELVEPAAARERKKSVVAR